MDKKPNFQHFFFGNGPTKKFNIFFLKDPTGTVTLSQYFAAAKPSPKKVIVKALTVW